jgi:hypothetical protein
MKLTSIMGPTAIVVISVVLSPLHAGSYGPFTLQDFQTRAAFELVVNESKPLTPSANRIATQSAYVTLAHGLVPGNSDGLEIQFSPSQSQRKLKLTYWRTMQRN